MCVDFITNVYNNNKIMYTQKIKNGYAQRRVEKVQIQITDLDCVVALST